MSSNKYFSQRSEWPLKTNAILTAVELFRKRKVEWIDLAESNPTRTILYPSSKLLKPLSSSDNLNYSPDPLGLWKAREVIARYYCRQGVHVKAEQIFLTASTSEAYSYLFRLLGKKAFHPGPYVI